LSTLLAPLGHKLLDLLISFIMLLIVFSVSVVSKLVVASRRATFLLLLKHVLLLLQHRELFLVVLVVFFTIVAHLIVVIVHAVFIHELLLSLASDAHLLVLAMVLVIIFFSVIFLVFTVVHFHVGMQLIDDLWFVIGSLERLLGLAIVHFLTVILVLVVIALAIILFFILTHLVLYRLLLLHGKPLLLLLLFKVDIVTFIIHAILIDELLFVLPANSFVMFTWLVSLLLIDLHELVWLILLLEHQELLLLLFIQDVHASIFTSCCWDTAREVGQLVQLVKVLRSLKQDLLVFRQMLVWVVVCVPQNCNVLLQISDLVVQIDEFLCLLFHE
jgi:hypothetical protein